MKSWMKASICMCISLMVCFICIGYAAVTDTLRIDGTVNVQATQYDIYITGITPESLGTITINNYYYTIVSASVSGVHLNQPSR